MILPVVTVNMATEPVTPQRVRDILSSFLCESEKQKANSLSVENRAETETPEATQTVPEETSSSVTSPDIACHRRSFSSFLKRAETFSLITWFAKPPELTPLVCSRYGWENTDYDLLHCTACHAHLSCLLPSNGNSADYKEACEALKKKLLTAHEKFCTLAVNPCPESFLKVCLHDVEELKKNFFQRVSTLRQSAQLLPDIDYTHMETWGFAECHAAKFCSEESMSETDTPTQVITLAFAGWTLGESSRQVLICSMCRRQVGLWNFTSVASRPTPGEEPRSSEDQQDVDGAGDLPPPSKLQKIELQNQMDPISSHHAWCPWLALRDPSEDAMIILPAADSSTDTSVSPALPQQSASSPGEQANSPLRGEGDASQVLSQKQPTWVLEVRLVAPGLLSQSRRLVQQIKQSSVVEGLHCIRKLLKAWSSPENRKSLTSSSSS